MGYWTLIEGPLADGLPMRVYIAERDGKLWSASVHDDLHPISEDEFEHRLNGAGKWMRRDSKTGSEALARAAREMKDYFAGRLTKFDVAINLRGTPFQVRVWKRLTEIPFASTQSYADVAEAIGHPSAFRAVGNANGRNNLPIFVPCHRVVASGGKLGGFTGGIGLKKRLLDHEGAVLGRKSASGRPLDMTAKFRAHSG